MRSHKVVDMTATAYDRRLRVEGPKIRSVQIVNHQAYRIEHREVGLPVGIFSIS